MFDGKFCIFLLFLKVIDNVLSFVFKRLEGKIIVLGIYFIDNLVFNEKNLLKFDVIFSLLVRKIVILKIVLKFVIYKFDEKFVLYNVILFIIDIML